ncbi:MAG TPA: S8 family serine peptidase, partial [Thermoanaerobaculia bacterium]
SLGGREGFGPLQQAVENAVRAGVVVVASAGNEALDPDAPADVGFPARYEAVIAVGSTGFDDRRAGYSNPGPGLDLMAPAGESPGIVRGATRDAALAPSFLHDPVTGEVIYTLFFATGTSFAAPQVAAAAALLMALGVDDPEAVRFVLEETARDLGPAGFDQETGHGLLDLLRAHQGLGFAS